MSARSVRVAIIQARPVVLDLDASLERAASLIDDAARDGAELVAFGEAWLSGYPAWVDTCPSAALWDHEPAKELYARLRASSIEVPSEETDSLARLARELGVVIVIGAHERVSRGPGHGSVYQCQLTFDATGALVNHHRKLVPTYTERLLWSHGDAAGLRAVDTDAGRVGGLICWEHFMPMARQVMHDEGEEIHIAAWPSLKEHHLIASRHYALEGRCFVLAAGSIFLGADLPDEMEKPAPFDANPDAFVINGGSTIIGPRGELIAGPVYDEETILVADLDLGAIDRESMTLDVSGHYFREDVFQYRVRRVRRIGAGIERATPITDDIDDFDGGDDSDDTGR